MNNRKPYHDTNDMAWCWHVAEVGRDRNSCKKHLTRGVLGRGTTSNGTHEIEITFVILVSGTLEQRYRRAYRQSNIRRELVLREQETSR